MLGGRYRLESVIGSGGMATVWAAIDTELERPVAVKVISETLAGDAAFMERFRREARIAAAFAHPNVVRLYDFSAEAERPFLVMEQVGGGTLSDRSGPRATPVEPTTLALQLLAALDHIHSAGVVHRDVKPANILFDSAGAALLTDFGIAQPDDATRHTQTGLVIGTLRYMAPEVQRGQGATPRSDLYSLGIVLRDCFDELEPRLAGLVARLTAANPGERPPSAAAARAELENYSAETVALGTRTTAPLPAGGGGRGRTLGLGLLALALAAIAVAIATLGGDDDDAPAPVASPATTTVTEPAAEAPSPPAETTTPPAADPPEQAPPAPAQPASCDQLEADKEQFDEDRKAAEKSLADDKEAKEAAKAQFEQQKSALEEQIKACKDAEKAAG